MKMSREEFVQFLATIRFGIAVQPPYDIVACKCGDINYHGWRLVARAAAQHRQPA